MEKCNEGFDIFEFLGEGHASDTVVQDLNCEITDEDIRDILNSQLLNNDLDDDQSSSGRSSESTEISPVTKTCPVCNTPVGRHSYYGAQVCLSCRGFFRRSVYSKQYQVFSCNKNENCSIDSKSRRSCKFCRFQKCLGAGMKLAWVLNEDQRKSRIVKRTSSHLMAKNASLLHPFTQEDIDLVNTSIRALINACHEKYYDVMLKGNSVMRSIVTCIFDGSCMMSTSQCRDLMAVDKQLIVNYLFSHSDLSKLTAFDRMTLISKNWNMIFSLLWAGFSGTKSDLLSYYKDFVNYGKRHYRNQPEIDEFVGSLDKLHLEDMREVEIPVENDRIVIGVEGGNQSLLYDLHGLVHKIYLSLVSEVTHAKDYNLFFMLMMVMLFERVDQLEEEQKVQKLQEQYVVMLERYLAEYHKKDRYKKLHEMMMSITYAKKVFDLWEKSSESFTSQSHVNLLLLE